MRICPKCKSKEVSMDTKQGISFITGVSEVYTCTKCGFSSEVFPEIKNG